jgi:alpha-L-rhamnosidase
MVVMVAVCSLAGCRPGAESDNKQGLHPERLHCEYLTAPEGIDVVSPRLSWIVTSPQRGQRQTAYRILVASDPAALQADKGDLWDSGKVLSDETLHVAYAGKALGSYQQCWWKVCVWDANDRASDWSKPGYWSMGILAADEWTGKWLGYVQSYTEEEAALKGSWKQAAASPMFRKTFTLDKDIHRAALYLCGLGFHEAYLNGGKVGDHVLDPAFTRYDRASLYVTHDVTSQVRKGDNALGVMLGNGWYNVFTRAAWDFDRAPWRAKPQLLAQLRVEYTDGTTETIVSDATWKASTGPVFLDGIRQGEWYDARREMDGWATADFDDSGWSEPELVSAPAGVLRAQVGPAIKVTESIEPVNITEPAPGVFVVDLGQNIAGWVQLKVAGPAGTKVQLRYAERLHPDGKLDQAAIKQHVREETFQTDTYILKGDGLETWEPRFTYHGFQYVEVTGFPGTPAKESITGRVVNTAFEQTGQFSSSSELANKMHHCILWAYRGNFVGYPMDCPHREKNGWMGDAHLAAEQAMYNWANGGGYTKWMLDIKDEQRPSGEVPGIVPTGGWGYAWGNGPAWDSAYLIIPWEMYRYYGDKRILEVHFDRFKRYVDYLTGRSEDHIINFGLNDWAPADTTTPTDITSTAFYYLDTLITARAAEILGYDDDAKTYAERAEAIKEAYQRHLYKGDGIYSVGSQTALSFPLYCGLVPESEKPKVLAKLVENIRSRDNHIDTGILGAKAIFNVLSENGYHDLAWQMAVNPTGPSYADWINQGATTFWEFWNGQDSRNHIMYGDIGAWFYKNLAGINLHPQIAGHEAFKHFILRPRLLNDLTAVTVSYESIRGTIGSAWTVEGRQFAWSVAVPANTTATIYIPATSAADVTESGRPADDAQGVSFMSVEDGYAVYTIQSGTYRFNAELP